jgi:hypothetical protein
VLHRTLIVAAAATLLAVISTSRAQAWGAAHVGYTHVGPNGVQHYGATAAKGPNGAAYSSRGGAYGASGSAHYSSGAAYHSAGYSGAAYGGAYHAGYARRW